MSDSPQQTPAVVAAQQALAAKEVNDRIDGLKKQVRNLWIAVAVIGVLVVVLAGFSVFARFLGVRTFGGQFPGGTRFQQQNGQQLNGSTGTQQTTPGQ